MLDVIHEVSASNTRHTPAMSPASVAAHQAASHVRSAPLDSDPRKAVSYTDAARAEHDRHCARCRALTEDTADRAAVYGESLRRRDRQQLGLRLTLAASVR